MPEVVEINDIDELEHYWLIWNALLAETPGASFFHSLDWLTTYWRHFGHRQKLRVLVVYSRGIPVGIVPLTVIRERTRVGRIRTLTYPLHDWGSFYGPIGPNPTATLTAAMQYLREIHRDWDLLDLRWIDRERHDVGRTRNAMRHAGWQGCESIWKETAVIDMTQSWEDYFASRTSKFRNNVRRAGKRVCEAGKVSFERHRPLSAADGDGDPRWDLYEQCIEVARQSWQGSSTNGTTLSHDSVSKFFHEAHALAAKAGAVDLCLLRLNGQPVAFAYNYHCDGRVFGLRAGYDARSAPPGMGTVLFQHVFQDSFERGDHLFDMASGSEKAKRSWMTHIERSYRYTHYNATPRVQMLRLKHWLRRRQQTSNSSKATAV